MKEFKIKDIDGTSYEVIMSFYWDKTKKNYVIYTDNSYDDMGNLMIGACIYVSSKLEEVKTSSEWDKIEEMLLQIKG